MVLLAIMEDGISSIRLKTPIFCILLAFSKRLTKTSIQTKCACKIKCAMFIFFENCATIYIYIKILVSVWRNYTAIFCFMLRVFRVVLDNTGEYRDDYLCSRYWGMVLLSIHSIKMLPTLKYKPCLTEHVVWIYAPSTTAIAKVQPWPLCGL